MKAIGYVRVSTDRQAEDGFGLDVQRAAIRKWCSATGARLHAIESDEGLSGTLGIDARPGLSAALAVLSDGAADTLVVPRLDRLARTLAVQEAALAHVWRHGGRVFAVDVGEVLRDDPDDPMRTAMRQMMGVFSQLERGMIAARLRAGRRHKAEHGGYAFGAPPFGFRSENGVLLPDPDAQNAIECARLLQSSGYSLRTICVMLEERGHRSPRGASWHPGSLARILARADET